LSEEGVDQEALLRELQRREQERREELQKRLLLNKLLEPDARQRLGNIRAANPELASKVEALIIYLYQEGQIKGKISDEQLKQILTKVGGRRETKIIRK
jgi:programmed cell death protein 5